MFVLNQESITDTAIITEICQWSITKELVADLSVKMLNNDMKNFHW